MDLNCIKVQQGLINIPAKPPEMSDLLHDIAMRQFRQVSIEETTRHVMKAPTKSCELDPIPTDLLKEVIHELSPILTDRIKTSLQQGSFPMEPQKSSSLTTTQKSHTGLHDQKEL